MLWYYFAMTKIEDIERAIAKLSPLELAEFRAWFEAFDAEQFDRKIDGDAKAGKLEKLAENARADHRSGRTRPL